MERSVSAASGRNQGADPGAVTRRQMNHPADSVSLAPGPGRGAQEVEPRGVEVAAAKIDGGGHGLLLPSDPGWRPVRRPVLTRQHRAEQEAHIHEGKKSQVHVCRKNCDNVGPHRTKTNRATLPGGSTS